MYSVGQVGLTDQWRSAMPSADLSTILVHFASHWAVVDFYFVKSLKNCTAHSILTFTASRISQRNFFSRQDDL